MTLTLKQAIVLGVGFAIGMNAVQLVMQLGLLLVAMAVG